jgi:hypothetical protein
LDTRRERTPGYRRSLIEQIETTYGTTTIPTGRTLVPGSETVSTLRDATQLVFLLKELVNGNWEAYQALNRDQALVVDLALSLARRRGLDVAAIRQVARSLVSESLHVEPCLVGAMLLSRIGSRDDLDVMCKLGAHPAFGGVFLTFVFEFFDDPVEATAYLQSVRTQTHGLRLMIDSLEIDGYL